MDILRISAVNAFPDGTSFASSLPGYGSETFNATGNFTSNAISLADSSSINKAGFSCDEITDVVFTHLHFDHCGGGSVVEKGSSFPSPKIPNFALPLKTSFLPRRLASRLINMVR